MGPHGYRPPKVKACGLHMHVHLLMSVLQRFLLQSIGRLHMKFCNEAQWCRTLPSNLALCVHPDFTYVKAKDPATGRVYIVAEALLHELPGAVPKESKKKDKAAKDSAPKKGGFEVCLLLSCVQSRCKTVSGLPPVWLLQQLWLPVHMMLRLAACPDHLVLLVI